MVLFLSYMLEIIAFMVAMTLVQVDIPPVSPMLVMVWGSHPNNDRIGVSSIGEVGVSHGNGDNDVDVDLVNAAHNSRNSNNNDSNFQELIQIDNDDNDHLDLAEFGQLHNNNST